MLKQLNHEYWMQQALGLAKKAESLGEVPVGALLVKDDKLIAESFNQPIKNNNPCAHAEILVLQLAGEELNNYRLIDSTLYVTLEPCAMCAMAMVHARIKQVVYAAPEPKTGAAGSLYQLLQHPAHNHQVEVISGVCEVQAVEQIQSFFRQRRKENKQKKSLS
ncbi:tRNA adenosine(34) deaminase TadA [Aliikangiella sp. IMCC44632]